MRFRGEKMNKSYKNSKYQHTKFPMKNISLIGLLSLLCCPLMLVAQTVNNNLGCTPLETAFTPPAGFSSYYWDFGDGTTSTLANPEHIFVQPGTYTVNFSTAPNQAVEGSLIVTVLEKPVLAIGADVTAGCVPLGVTFENNSEVDSRINVISYSWVFGDATPSSADIAPTHTYNQLGAFSVSLGLETDVVGCDVTTVFEDFIETVEAPEVSFTTNPNPPSACAAPLTISFENTSSPASGMTYEWDFGNGLTHQGYDAPSQTYTEIGQYNVVLTGINAAGCSSTFEQLIGVGSPASSFIFPDTVCIGEPIRPDNMSSGGMSTWSVNGNADINNPNTSRPTFTFLEEGLIIVTLNTATGECSADFSQEIFVESIDADFTISPANACQRPTEITLNAMATNAVSYTWETTDPAVGEEELFSTAANATFTAEYITRNPYYIEQDSVNQTFILMVESPAGCKATAEKVFKTLQPTAIFEVDVAEGCAPLNINFVDTMSLVESEIVNWEWHFGTGETITTQEGNVAYTYENAGDYDAFLVIENQSGCLDTSYFLPIKVGSTLTPDFEVSATEVCAGEEIEIRTTTTDDVIDAWHFETDNGRSFHCFNEDELDWSFTTETGLMDVSLTVEYNGCYSTITKPDLVNVRGPIAHIEYKMDCENPLEYQFNSGSEEATAVTWFFGDSIESELIAPTHTYDTTGNYTVYLEAVNTDSNCPVSVDTVEVFVRDIQADFVLDTLLCKDAPYNLDASVSQDVEANCYRGYTWFLPDNRPITTQDSTLDHSFSTPGRQEIMLETTDINGCRDSTFLEVEVYELIADFEQDQTIICFPTEVNFQDKSSGDTTLVAWNWNFDGQATSTELNPSHIFTPPIPLDTAGVLNISLTVEDAIGCQVTQSYPLNYYQPISTITSQPSPNICVGETLNLSASDFTTQGSNLAWNWNFPDGTTANTQQTSFTFTEVGTQEVLLNFVEVATNCPNSTTLEVDVQGYPDANFTSSVDDLDIICYPQNVQFENTSISDIPLSSQWDFGNGQQTTIDNPSASYGKGTFEAQLIVSTSYGCADTTLQSYTLVGPEGDFELNATEACLGNAFVLDLRDTVDVSSFVWDFNDGTALVNDQSPVEHTYLNAGAQLVTLILKGAGDACVLPVQKNLNVLETNAGFELLNQEGDEICLNQSVSLINTSDDANLYQWIVNGNVVSMDENLEQSFTNADETEIQLIATYAPLGCADTLSQTFNIVAPPNIFIEEEGVCMNNSAFLSITDSKENSQYTWQPTSSLMDTEGTEVETVALNETTTFIVSETTENGCVNSDTVSIVVVPVITGDTTNFFTCIDSPVTLEVPQNDLYTYTWTPPTDLSCTDCTTTTLASNQSTLITAFPMDIFGLGCAVNPFVFDVTVMEEFAQIPNIFTPNNDGVNDFFDIVAEEEIREEIVINGFQIYNRFGQLVYDNDTPETGWDGMFKGKMVPSDVYIYMISVSYEDCENLVLQGDLTVLR